MSGHALWFGFKASGELRRAGGKAVVGDWRLTGCQNAPERQGVCGGLW